MIGRRKRILLSLAGAALSFVAAAALVATPASAQVAAHFTSTHAVPEASSSCGSSPKIVAESAAVDYNGVKYGEVYLCYNTTTRDVWAIVDSTDGSCQSDSVGCGSAEVYNNNNGKNSSCNIAVGGSSCTTGLIDDAGTTSYAFADIILTSSGSKVARGSTASF